jgi:hypothetical protein
VRLKIELLQAPLLPDVVQRYVGRLFDHTFFENALVPENVVLKSRLANARKAPPKPLLVDRQLPRGTTLAVRSNHA